MKKWIAVVSIFACCLLEAAPDWLEGTSDLWKRYKRETTENIGSIPGWCCPEKAEKMMDLILEVRPEICVEVGVFGGSSIFPTARALNCLPSGRVYCIDPWMQQPALEGYSSDNPHHQWWSKINHDEVLNGFLKMLSKWNLAHRCAVLRMKSEEAVFWFEDESIDILHIDGNKQDALKDTSLFLPKVKKGGYIWYDDTDWTATIAAQQMLFANCTLIEERSVGNSCRLFRKN